MFQSFGELPAARLSALVPPGGKRGNITEVSITGTDLEGGLQMRFSHPGISAELKSTNLFAVRIDADVPPGFYDAWVIGNFGASNPRTFEVGALDELTKTNGIHQLEHAQKISLSQTVNGHTDANAIDYFKFSARQGQCVIVECQAAELDSKLEPVLTLRNEAGHELTRSRRGSGLNFRIPIDGTFSVSLHDVIYRGGPEYFYRLSVGTFPQIESINPIGTRGEKTKFLLKGYNLALAGGNRITGKAEPEDLEIELSRADSRIKKARSRLPAAAALDIFECRMQNDSGFSGPAYFAFPGESVSPSSPTNNTAESAQKISVPDEITGQFASDRKASWFTFDAKKGDAFWMELLSQRLGWPSDPLLIVQRVTTNGPADLLELNDSEENIGGVAFTTKHRDPNGRFEAKEDGSYRIQVKDLFTHNQGGSSASYSLRLRKPLPDFQLAAIPMQPAPAAKDSKAVTLATTLLRRNGTVPIQVVAFRRDGFEGAITLFAEGLPKGVTALEAKIETGQTSALLWLQAEEQAASDAVSVKIRGTSEINATREVRESAAVTLLSSVNDYTVEPVRSRTCAQYLLSTLAETAPIRIYSAGKIPIEGISTGKVVISLLIERSSEFNIGNFAVVPVGVPALDGLKEFEISNTATNANIEIDLAQQKLAPGKYAFAFRGLAKGKRIKPSASDVEFTVYSAPISLTVNAPAK